ncbi:Ldh family oxidoreductase [Salirhabdus salicampi]|nr:Ldh family oxidoreductase [Salirhabdus salicampi]
MRIAKRNGESIPLGWALDSSGQPTTDTAEALKGNVLPIGEYKGYGIALMVEILSGVLTGADFSTKMVDHDADGKRNVGHLFISLNLEHFTDPVTFQSRLAELTDSIKNAPRVNEEQEVFLPGEQEMRVKANQQPDHVYLTDRSYQVFKTLCRDYV